MNTTALRYFTLAEFACHCGQCENKIDPEFVGKCDELRHRCGFALKVNSGYRCPAYNRRVSTTGATGPHTTGHAADFDVNRTEAFIVMRESSAMGFTGFGFQQKGAGRYLHLDDLPNAPGQPRPTVWSY